MAWFGRAATAAAAPTEAAATFTATTEPAPVAVGSTTASGPLLPSVAGRMLRDIAMAVPAVRRGRQLICSTIATFPWKCRDLTSGAIVPMSDQRVSWLQQPEPDFTRLHTLTWTLDDLLWHDRAVWYVRDTRLMGGLPAAVERIQPSRIDTVPDPTNPDRVATWVIDGREVTTPSRLIVFRGGGLGGLAWNGQVIDIAAKLLASAGRYAASPLPAQVLRNKGRDLTEAEISSLLDVWEAARQESATAYMNQAIDLEVPAGAWSAKELQLVEAREQAATEIARLMGLPATALDASAASGQSMTYGNRVDDRLELLEALKPWRQVLEQTLSMVRRAGTAASAGLVIPQQLELQLDTSDFSRPSAKDRMDTWKAAREAEVLTIDEIRALEPLTQTGGPAA